MDMNDVIESIISQNADQAQESELVSIDQTLPKHIYIIPIRYRPIFPGIITPLIISQGRFSDSIDRVLNSTRAWFCCAKMKSTTSNTATFTLSAPPPKF
jgi:ATP-dependent Lon protease